MFVNTDSNLYSVFCATFITRLEVNPFFTSPPRAFNGAHRARGSVLQRPLSQPCSRLQPPQGRPARSRCPPSRPPARGPARLLTAGVMWLAEDGGRGAPRRLGCGDTRGLWDYWRETDSEFGWAEKRGKGENGGGAVVGSHLVAGQESLGKLGAELRAGSEVRAFGRTDSQTPQQWQHGKNKYGDAYLVSLLLWCTNKFAPVSAVDERQWCMIITLNLISKNLWCCWLLFKQNYKNNTM